MAAGRRGNLYLVFIKFVEVFARAAFIVGVAYSLPLDAAGQFGLVATLVGLFAFAFNWERQVDIQRRFVDAPPEVFDRAVKAALPFWGFNQVLMLPVFAVLCWAMAHLTAWQLLLAILIVSCEHVANQTYQMALISRRYWQFLNIVAAKNIAILAAVIPYILFAPSKLTLDYALIVWAVGQVVCAAAVFVLWRRISVAAPHDEAFSFKGRILSQHRDSLTHFLIGLLAMGGLQFDRLTVGALLPLAETGVYFRHVLAVSFVYQFFNVAFYNRMVPALFALAKAGPLKALVPKIVRELAIVIGLAIAGFAAALFIDRATDGVIAAKYALSPLLGGVLLTGALLRVSGDFLALPCHARMAERLVLRSQLVTFGVGASALMALTWRFGTIGAAWATVIAGGTYLVMMLIALRRVLVDD